jgi:hypothetical protein
MKIGTRSVLFGAHQFLLHPLCLAVAWTRLYGFPRQWQLWLCFFVHDFGYWQKPDIDGKEGQRHPEMGARIVLWVTGSMHWHNFCLFHSRHYAKAMAKTASRLCVADKLAFAVTPKWLYLLTTGWTGELEEYMANGAHAKNPPCTDHEVWCLKSGIPGFWHDGLRSYMIRWTAKHHHDQDDAWTKLETSR